MGYRIAATATSTATPNAPQNSMPPLAPGIAALALTLAPAAPNTQSQSGGCVEVFTTAMDSDLRMAPDGGLQLLPDGANTQQR